MIDRRPTPAKPVALDDAGLRAATQVRVPGAETHRRDPVTGYAECGGLNQIAPWVLIRTTRPVTCRRDGCLGGEQHG